MKKRSSSQQSRKRTVKSKCIQESVTIGMDLGDRSSRYCMLNSEGGILREDQVPTTKAGMMATFGSLGRARIAIGVGPISRGVRRANLSAARAH
jgi:transposase